MQSYSIFGISGVISHSISEYFAAKSEIECSCTEFPILMSLYLKHHNSKFCSIHLNEFYSESVLKTNEN